MQLQSDNGGKVSVSGDLTLDSVESVFKDSGGVITPATRTIDLANVARVDSAGLALLLEWQATARRAGPGMDFTNAPEDLIRLAALSEASSLLGFKSRPTTGAPS